MATVKVKNKDNEWVSVGSVSMKAQLEPIVLTGDQNYGCSGALASNYIALFGDTITTNDITRATYMFEKYPLEKIPFDINFKTGRSHDANYFFSVAKIKELPNLNNFSPSKLSNLFDGCAYIRHIPEDYFDKWDWSYIDNATSTYDGSMANMFYNCHSLRKLPMRLYEHGNPVANYSYSIYYGMTYGCYVLDEIVDLPYPHNNATWTSNAFSNTFGSCYRLKDITFKMPDGKPYVVKWKNQTITIEKNIGYTTATSYIYDYSSITREKVVVDDATYQALKNDPDWFTSDVAYCRYNHDSAVNTINSLPDTSAYLATAGGTNTIKFKGTLGSKTDGGAINTLTEEEIAVAAAKGWTVSLV